MPSLRPTDTDTPPRTAAVNSDPKYTWHASQESKAQEQISSPWSDILSISIMPRQYLANDHLDTSHKHIFDSLEKYSTRQSPPISGTHVKILVVGGCIIDLTGPQPCSECPYRRPDTHSTAFPLIPSPSSTLSAVHVLRGFSAFHSSWILHEWI